MNARTRSCTQTLPKTRKSRQAVPLEGRLGLTQAEAAAAIGKSPSCLRRWTRLGIGPAAVRCGGRALIFPIDGPNGLRAWITRNAVDPADLIER
jgi:hypothetical protein